MKSKRIKSSSGEQIGQILLFSIVLLASESAKAKDLMARLVPAWVVISYASERGQTAAF